MRCEVLVSTMNQECKNKLIQEMRINDCVIINQVTKSVSHLSDELRSRQKFLTFYEKGLSKSRNNALLNSSGDICILADDDMYYENNYENIISEAYHKYSDADLIAFVVDDDDSSRRKKIMKEGKIHYLKSMKLQSVQITFKRKSIIANKIMFDESFGTGAQYYWGEENIFLFDCLRSGLKIYYVPKRIATLKVSDSSWNKDNTPEHFQIQGCIYYRMTRHFYLILILQFALRKRSIYKKDMTTIQVVKNMIIGARRLKKSNSNPIV